MSNRVAAVSPASGTASLVAAPRPSAAPPTPGAPLEAAFSLQGV